MGTRVKIEAAYLPAYGAISFLPFSLRPIFAWISSVILQRLGSKDGLNRNRHDKLLCPVLVLASLSFLGTIFIPTNGVVLCFVWGFLRGVAGAWSDFLIGMTVIEFSKLQSTLIPNNTSYEQITSMNTAQSSTAKNIGGFLASIGTFIFFSQNQSISEKVANTLLLVTALILLLASFASIKYQYHVSKMLDQSTYDSIDNDEDINDDEDIHEVEQSTEEDRDAIIEEETANTTSHRQQIIEVSTLISFQILLAISALRVPIVAVSSQQIWIALMITFVIILGCTLCIGYKHEKQQQQQQQQQSDTTHTRRMKDDKERLSHRRLNLYFLLRYSLPIAGFIMYSYLYTVFESQPLFLQLMSVLKTAIGSLSTYTYEKFLSPRCHSGLNLIGLIAILDITMGLIALLDVWVIRAARDRLVDGEYMIDTKLKWLVATVGLVKYFFAELDYQPSLVLSTTNVYNDDDNTLPSEEKLFDDFNDETEAFDEYEHKSNTPPSLSIDFNDDNNESFSSASSSSPQKPPLVSQGMQYASFLSCIDFGAQIGDWISVPIIASLGITRENHWDNLDKYVILCSFLRMGRVVFLWLIRPTVH